MTENQGVTGLIIERQYERNRTQKFLGFLCQLLRTGGGTPKGDQVYMCPSIGITGKIKKILPWLQVKIKKELDILPLK